MSAPGLVLGGGALGPVLPVACTQGGTGEPSPQSQQVCLRTISVCPGGFVSCKTCAKGKCRSNVIGVPEARTHSSAPRGLSALPPGPRAVKQRVCISRGRRCLARRGTPWILFWRKACVHICTRKDVPAAQCWLPPPRPQPSRQVQRANRSLDKLVLANASAGSPPYRVLNWKTRSRSCGRGCGVGGPLALPMGGSL